MNLKSYLTSHCLSLFIYFIIRVPAATMRVNELKAHRIAQGTQPYQRMLVARVMTVIEGNSTIRTHFFLTEHSRITSTPIYKMRASYLIQSASLEFLKYFKHLWMLFQNWVLGQSTRQLYRILRENMEIYLYIWNNTVLPLNYKLFLWGKGAGKFLIDTPSQECSIISTDLIFSKCTSSNITQSLEIRKHKRRQFPSVIKLQTFIAHKKWFNFLGFYI